MKGIIFIGIVFAIFAHSQAALRFRRGFGGGGGSYGGGGGGGGGGGYSGGGGGASHVLIAGGSGYGTEAGPASHVLNAGSGPAFHGHGGPQEQWYKYAAIAAGDPYAAKTIAAGQFAVNQADAAAYTAAQGIYAAANDPAIAREATYAAKAAQAAWLSAASHAGAAAVYTGTARIH